MKKTSDTIADFNIKKKQFSHWAGILEEWTLAIERFCRITRGTDNPYWYNERANVGILAGAAWRSGKVALEEFQTKKIEVAEDGTIDEAPGREKSGRCDLWIADDRHSEHIEAKFKWINLLSDRLTELAEASLADAVADATKISGIEEMTGLGVVFLPVYIKANKVSKENPIEDSMHNAIYDISKIKCDVVAWSFPHHFREFVGQNYGNHMPGIFMLVKKA